MVYNDTGHAETVKVDYDPSKVSLTQLIDYYLLVVNPTSINQQGNDRGHQYRSGGIYYTDAKEKEIIVNRLKREQEKI